MTSKNFKDTKDAESDGNSKLYWAAHIIITALMCVFVATILSPNFRTKPIDSNPAFAKHFDSKTPFVEDNANKLSETTRKRVADLNQRAADEPGHPKLLVVTVDSIKGFSLAKLADKKGEQYGIGSKESNQGLVYVVAVKERRDYLATSRGMKSKITPFMASDIIDSNVSFSKGNHNFNEGDFDKGINTVLSTVQPYFLGERTASDYPKSKFKAVYLPLLLALLVSLVLTLSIVGAVSAFNHKFSRKDSHDDNETASSSNDTSKALDDQHDDDNLSPDDTNLI